MKPGGSGRAAPCEERLVWPMQLKHRHPALVLLFYGAALTLTMATQTPWVLLSSFLSAFFLSVRLSGSRRAVRNLLYVLPVILILGLVNTWFYGRGLTVLIQLKYRPVTLESLVYGCFSGVMLAAVLMWFMNYHATMATGRFMALISRAFPVVSMMIAMIFRYLPDILNEAMQMERAREAILGSKPKGLRRRYRHAVRMTSALMVWSMEHAIETADAMLARGYDSARRKPYARVRWQRQDVPVLIALVVLLPAVFYLFRLGGAGFLYYPILKVQQRAAGGSALALTAAVTLFFSLPLWLDLKYGFVRLVRKPGWCDPADLPPAVRAMLPADLKVRSDGSCRPANACGTIHACRTPAACEPERTR